MYNPLVPSNYIRLGTVCGFMVVFCAYAILSPAFLVRDNYEHDGDEGNGQRVLPNNKQTKESTGFLGNAPLVEEENVMLEKDEQC